MDLLEYQGKQLFARHGLKVSSGEAVTTVEDAVRAADEIGYPVVVKAQVLIGGRGKAGGVKLAADEAQAREHATSILGLDIRGHIVRTLWIEHASDIATEYYASVLLDRSAKQPLVMFSVEGGVEIEQVAEQSPEKLMRHHVDALDGLSREEAVEIATRGGADADVVQGVADALLALYEVWTQEDATLAEINPLIVTPEREVKALDAKVSLDGNALYRHPENQGCPTPRTKIRSSARAKEQGVQYVKLDGDIGILGNGAGLVMSTLDVVAQAGGSPANFLDAGGGSDAEKIKQAVQLILANDAVKAVLFNIFGGITRGDEVARGLIAAFEEIKPSVRSWCAWTGRTTSRGASSCRRRHWETCMPPGRWTRPPRRSWLSRPARARESQSDGGSRRRADAPGGRGHHRPRGHLSHAQQPQLRHERRRRRHPGQGRPGRRGHSRVRQLGAGHAGGPAEHGDDLRPAAVRRRLDPRGGRGRVELVIAITEGIPAHDELRVYNTLKRDHPGTRLIGPNCPGILSPGKANVGIIPASFFKEGNVGVVSRSGTLTYQIGNEIAQAGFGCSSIVGIGGDPVPGSSFVDVLELFEADDQTELIVLSGEIGGSAEEEAAEYIAEHVTKPVVAYIAGFTAPAGKQMGHAGAIVSGTSGTAAAKASALEAKGVRVGRTPTEVAEIAVEVLGGASLTAS